MHCKWDPCMVVPPRRAPVRVLQPLLPYTLTLFPLPFSSHMLQKTEAQFKQRFLENQMQDMQEQMRGLLVRQVRWGPW